MQASLDNLPLEVLRSIAKHAAQVDDRAPITLAATCKRLRRILQDDTVFWKQLVIAAFDFFVGRDVLSGFEENRLFDLDEGQEELLAAAREVFGEDTFEDPDEDDDEPSFLMENPSWWSRIGERGIYFRASQYGFLGDIQRGTKDLGSWPHGEDPLTLYKDLLLLSTKLAAATDRINLSSEGSDETIPVLLARPMSDSDITDSSHDSDDEKIEMTQGGHNKATLFQYIKATGYTPYVWAQLANNPDAGGIMDGSSEESKKLTIEEICAMKEFSNLTEVMGLNPNRGSDGATPLFVIGKSAFSGRILGVVGELVWT